MINTVLLTRSESQNVSFQNLLHGELGENIELVTLPLLRYVPCDLSSHSRQTILDFDRFDKVIFISQNAVKYGLPKLEAYWPQWPQAILWMAVGPATAERLAEQDIIAQTPSLASSEGLLKLPELQAPVAGRVLIVRGIGGRELLKETLLQRGAQVEYLEAYQRQVIAYESDVAKSLTETVIATVYSGEAMTRLVELVADVARFQLLVPSKRLQSMAFKYGFDRVELARSQQDTDMADALLGILGKQEE